MRRTLASSLLLASAVLAGCTTPYSQIYGTRYYQAPMDTYPVAVIAVDGEHYVRQPVQIDPGPRKITVQAPPTASSRGEQQTITLDVKPCTRYYLVAVKENPLSNDFNVKVDYEEPVPGCTRKG